MNKRFSLTLVIPNYTIASFTARFECEHPEVRSQVPTTLIFPDAKTLQPFLIELKRMGIINSNPNRLITLT